MHQDDVGKDAPSHAPLPRILFVLFLGLPGILLWIGGFTSLLVTSALSVLDLSDFWPAGFVSMTLSAAVASLGFIMFTAAKLISNEKGFGIHSRHLPAMIGFHLAAMISGAVALSSSFVTVGVLVLRQGNIAAPLTALTSISILATLLHLHPALEAKWKPQTEEERLGPGLTGSKPPTDGAWP
jgi:hypothetical protein